jgi:hydrogenase maturation protease
MSRGLLVAGIGNIFQTDDAFEVALRLSERDLPPGVTVEDYGIRGVHLAYELLESYDGLVLVDAVAMGEPPGTLAIIAPELAPAPDETYEGPPVVDAHTMSPGIVLATLARLGGGLERVYVLGCQPANVDEGMGLSPPVAAVVESAVEMCLELVSELLEPAGKGTPS